MFHPFTKLQPFQNQTLKTEVDWFVQFFGKPSNLDNNTVPTKTINRIQLADIASR